MAEVPDEPPSTPHDTIFKVVFGEPANAAVVVGAALPPPLAAALDLERLQPGPTVVVGADHRQGARDLMFHTTLRSAPVEVTVELLFEHTSTPRPRQRLRLNGYLQRRWEASERRRRADRREPNALPVILPVVLSQGPDPWTIPTLVDLFELPPDLAALVAPFTPTFEVAMLDLGGWSEDRLRTLPEGLARLALVVMKGARSDVDLVDVFARMPDDVARVCAAGSSRLLAELVSYTAWVRGEDAGQEYFERVQRAVQPPGRKVVMGAFMLFEDRKRLEGARMLLLKQLRARFGELSELHVSRVDAASQEDVERWGVRLMTAATIDDVFADPTT
jgi:hypothetical protein